MELLTMEKKIKVLEHAFAASAGAYYSINLTQNLVPGTMYQVIDDEEYSINEQIGMPDNAAFFDFFEISNLLKCVYCKIKM